MNKKIKWMILWLLLLFVLIFTAGCKNKKTTKLKYNEDNPGEIFYEATPEENSAETEKGLEYANNEVLIVAKEGVKKSKIEKLASEYDAEIIGYIEVTGDYQWRLNKAYTYDELEELVEKLKQEELVEDASIQSIMEMETSDFTTPNDTRWVNEWDELNPDGENWGIEAIRAPYTWQYKEDMTPIKMGLIDCMFNTEHEDVKFAETFYNPSKDKITEDHGTHVAGTMAATYDNNRGITGVYPFGENNIYGVAIDGTSNKSCLFFWKSAFAELIVRNVKVINVSLGYEDAFAYNAASGNTDYQSVIEFQAKVMGDFLEKFIKQGYDFVITNAAGNGKNNYYLKEEDKWVKLEQYQKGAETGCDGMANWNHFLAAINNKDVKNRIIVVGAAQLEKSWFSREYKITDFSNTGTRIDVMAPGYGICSASFGVDGYQLKSGTSMAAPHVAGTAAIIWSFNTGLTGERVKKIIMDSCKGEFQEVEGTNIGMINALAALADAADERAEGNPIKTQKAILTSQVRNQLNEELSGVNVTLVNGETGKTIDNTKTDMEGVFEFIVSEGIYQLLLSADGYENLEVKEICVKNGMVTEISRNKMIMKEIVSDVEISEDMVMTIGELGVIEPKVISPTSSTYEFSKAYSFKWTSSNEDVATVTPIGEVGIIRAKSKGETVITATLESGGKTISKSTNLRVASKGRDTVLVLDISGSMYGTPMKEMKESAIDFCNELLKDEYNNRVGLVFYDHEITSIDLTNELDSLIDDINSVTDGGRTNMEGAIAAAKDMLDYQGKPDSIKNIVVMADGLPNQGATSDSGAMQMSINSNYTDTEYANAVIDTAQVAMQSYNMYSLGFFHDLDGEELNFAVALMTKLTNQEDGYHQVEDAENLQFAFGDISEEISDGSKVIVNIACPVDVSITYNGETISSAAESFQDNTSFGTLQLLGSNKDIKVLSLEPGISYDVQLTGTGIGEMNYFINYLDENEKMIDSREFAAVPITPTTKIISNTDNSSEKMDLNIDENGDGEVDVVWSAEKNGKGEITYNNVPEPVEEVEEEVKIEESGLEVWQIILIALGIFFVLGGVVLVVVLTGRKSVQDDGYNEENDQQEEKDKNKKEEQETEDKEPVYIPAISVLSGPLAGADIPIRDHEIIYLGKDAKKANIVFSGDYPNISRLHCSVMYDKKYGKYFVTDCSTNGTFYLNQRRMIKGKRTLVEPGTILMLANEKAKIKLN